MNRLAGQRIWLKKLLGFRILRIYFTDWRILIAQRIADFFNISSWIMDFVCFEVRIVELNVLNLAVLAVCFNLFCCLTLENDIRSLTVNVIGLQITLGDLGPQDPAFRLDKKPLSLPRVYTSYTIGDHRSTWRVRSLRQRRSIAWLFSTEKVRKAMTSFRKTSFGAVSIRANGNP